MCLTWTYIEWCYTGQLSHFKKTSVQTLGSLLGSWVDRRERLDSHQTPTVNQ